RLCVVPKSIPMIMISASNSWLRGSGQPPTMAPPTKPVVSHDRNGRTEPAKTNPSFGSLQPNSHVADHGTVTAAPTRENAAGCHKPPRHVADDRGGSGTRRGFCPALTFSHRI